MEIKAVNPSRKQLNKLLGREDQDSDSPVEYMSEDKEGNTRVRLSFWLYDGSLDKYFVHSFNVTKKERVSNDGTKNQWINNVASTCWSDKEENLPGWFTTFTDKSGKVTGKKTFRKAYVGEEELANLLHAWLGKIRFAHPDAEVAIEMDRIFDGDFSELQDLVGSDFDTPFVALVGVETDDEDPNKQYQKIWHKGFLSAQHWPFIEKGSFKGAKEWITKGYQKFENDVTGQYGFTAYYTLEPIAKYDPKDDTSTAESTKAGVTPYNSKY